MTLPSVRAPMLVLVFALAGGPVVAQTILQNGVPLGGQSGAQSASTFYQISVPSGNSLVVTTSGGTGDVDLYVRFGQQPGTVTGSYDCRSNATSNAETCTFASTQSGTYHILLFGFHPYSGVTITATYTASPPLAQLVSFQRSASTITLGQSVDLTLTGRNNGGPTNTEGYLSIAFPSLTATVDEGEVTLLSAAGGAYKEYGQGKTIFTTSGTPMPAQYLLTEYNRTAWAGTVTSIFAVRWTPTRPGTFTVQAKVALQVLGNSYSRDPTSGQLDQQGAVTTTLTITVLAPQPPVATLLSFGSSTPSLTLGQSVDLTITGRNDGGTTNPNGYLSIGFPGLTSGTDDGQLVAVSNGGGNYNEYANGDLIHNVNNVQFPAQYLLAEYDRAQWANGVTSTLVVRWTPTVPGTYTLEGKIALQINATSYDRKPTTGRIDQQGAATQVITITVNPNPPVAQLVSFQQDRSTITLGQSVDLSLVGRNTGGTTNPDGYMSIAFPDLTGAGDDAEVVALSNAGGSYLEYPHGQSIFDVNGVQIPAQYLLSEFSRNLWPGNTSSTLDVRWTPTRTGTFTVEGKVALQVSGNSYSRDPATGNLDQQGARVRTLTVTVLPIPTGPLTLGLRYNGQSYTANPGSSLGVQLFDANMNFLNPPGTVLGGGPNFSMGTLPLGSYRADVFQGGIKIGEQWIWHDPGVPGPVLVDLLTQVRLNVTAYHADGINPLPAGYSVTVQDLTAPVPGTVAQGATNGQGVAALTVFPTTLSGPNAYTLVLQAPTGQVLLTRLGVPVVSDPTAVALVAPLVAVSVRTEEGGAPYVVPSGVTLQATLYDAANQVVAISAPSTTHFLAFPAITAGPNYSAIVYRGGLVIARTGNFDVTGTGPVTAVAGVITRRTTFLMIEMTGDNRGAGDSIHMEVRDPSGFLVAEGYSGDVNPGGGAIESGLMVGLLSTDWSGGARYTLTADIEGQPLLTPAVPFEVKVLTLLPPFYPTVTVSVPRSKMAVACDKAGAYRLTRRIMPSLGPVDGVRRIAVLVHGYVPEQMNCGQALRPVRSQPAAVNGQWDEWGSDYFFAAPAEPWEWSNEATRLASLGYEVWSYRWPTDLSMKEAGTQLAIRADPAFGAGSQVVVFGHSLGGLVGRIYASRSINPNVKVVTAGTPNLGSDFVDIVACGILGPFAPWIGLNCSSEPVQEVSPSTSVSTLFYSFLESAERQRRPQIPTDHVFAIAGTHFGNHPSNWGVCYEAGGTSYGPCDGLIEAVAVFGVSGNPRRMHHQLRQGGLALQDYDHGQLKLFGGQVDHGITYQLPNDLLRDRIREALAFVPRPQLSTGTPLLGGALGVSWQAADHPGAVGAVVQVFRDAALTQLTLTDTLRTPGTQHSIALTSRFLDGVTYYLRVAPVYEFVTSATGDNQVNDLVSVGQPSGPAQFTPRTATQLVFSVQPSSVVLGASPIPAVTVSALTPTGNVATGFAGTVTLTLQGGTPGAVLSSAVAQAVNGVASFPQLSVGQIGSGYALVASAGGLPSSAPSNQFDVNVALAFSVGPSNVTAGVIMPEVVVSARDAAGATVTAYVGQVDLQLSGGDPAATLSGGQAMAVSGLARFPGLSIDLSGTQYALTASGPDAPPVTSYLFQVRPGSYQLIVGGAGTGTGRIQSTNVGGIDCFITSGTAATTGCAYDYLTGQSVNLQATAGSLMSFGGDCAGMSCNVVMTRGRSVTAAFATSQMTLTSAAPNPVILGPTPVTVTLSGTSFTGVTTILIGGVDVTSAFDPSVSTTTDLVLGLSDVFNLPSGPLDVEIRSSSLPSVVSPGLLTVQLPPATGQVVIHTTGTGTGVVFTPAGITPAIQCNIMNGLLTGPACSGVYPAGMPVTLMQSAAGGSAFTGWGGACAGTSPFQDCQLSAGSGVLDVLAGYDPTPPPGMVISDVTPSSIRLGPSAQLVSINGSGFIDLTDVRIGGVSVFSTLQVPYSTTSLVVSLQSGMGMSVGPQTVTAVSSTLGPASLTDALTLLADPVLTVAGPGPGGGDGRVVSVPAGLDCQILDGAATGPACAAPFPAGTNVEVQASAGAGWSFDLWGGSANYCGPYLRCSIQLDADASVTPTFVVPTGGLAFSLEPVSVLDGDSIPVEVITVDANGNFDPSSPPTPITLTLDPQSPGAQLGGAVTVTSFAGRALFTDLSIGQVGVGYRLIASGFRRTSSAPSQPFDVGLGRRLTITGQGDGDVGVVSSPAGIDCVIIGGAVTAGICTRRFVHGNVVTLNVSGSAAALRSWTGDCAGTPVTSDCVLLMDRDRTAGVDVLGPQNISVTGNGTGSGTVQSQGGLPPLDCTLDPAGPGGPCSSAFLPHTTAILTATPLSGSEFKGWGGDCQGDTTCVLFIDRPYQVTATFDAAAISILAIDQQPAQAPDGQPFLVQPVLSLRDAAGQIVATPGVAVLAEIESGPGTLSSPGGFGLTGTSDQSGMVYFQDLAISGTGYHRLRFTTPGLSAAVTDSFPVLPALSNVTPFMMLTAPIVDAIHTEYASVTVYNTGLVPAPAGVEVNLYLSDDGQLDASDRLIGTGQALESVDPYSPGYDVTLPLMPPPGVLPGIRYVLAELDPNNTVPELNESDNVTSSGAVTVLASLTLDVGGDLDGAVSTADQGFYGDLIDCQWQAGVATGTCLDSYLANAGVTLTASAAAGAFVTWTSPDPGFDCTAGSQCVVAMDRTRTVTVTFSSTPPVVLSVTPVDHRDTTLAGNISADSAAITITAAAPADWTATASGYLSIVPNTGTGSGMLRWTRQTAGLTPGSYTADITVTVVGAQGSPAIVHDTLVIVSPLSVSLLPAGGADSIVAGDPIPHPGAASIQLQGHSGSAPLVTPSVTGAEFVGSLSALGTTITWSRSAGSLSQGWHVDSIVVVVEGPLNADTSLYVDSLLILPPLTSTIAPSTTRDTIIVGQAGADDSASVSFQGSGSATAGWSVQLSGDGYLRLLSPATGVGDFTLLFARDTIGLGPGTYAGAATVDVSGQTAASLMVSDTFVILPTPSIALGSALRVDTLPVGAQPVLDSVQVTLGGSGASRVTWAATAVGPGYLTLTDSTGDSGDWLRWRRDPAGLSVGRYSTVLTAAVVEVGGVTSSLTDSLEIVAQLSISVSSHLTRDSLNSGDPAKADSMQVHLTGFQASGSTWQASVPPGSYASLLTTSGITGGWLLFRRNPQGLAGGNHVTTFTVTAAGASNTPFVVADTLFVYVPLYLTILPSGPVAGRITSLPAGIDCVWSGAGSSGQCQVDARGLGPLTLSTTRTADVVFLGWPSPCTGYEDCTVAPVQPVTLAVSFQALNCQDVTTRATRELLGRPALTAAERAHLDHFGNTDGSSNGGDLLGLLERCGMALPPLAERSAPAASRAAGRTPHTSPGPVQKPKEVQ